MNNQSITDEISINTETIKINLFALLQRRKKACSYSITYCIFLTIITNCVFTENTHFCGLIYISVYPKSLSIAPYYLKLLNLQMSFVREYDFVVCTVYSLIVISTYVVMGNCRHTVDALAFDLAEHLRCDSLGRKRDDNFREKGYTKTWLLYGAGV